MPIDDEVLTVDGAAALLGVSKITIRPYDWTRRAALLSRRTSA